MSGVPPGRRRSWGLSLVVVAVLATMAWDTPAAARASDQTARPSEQDVDGRRRYRPPIDAPVVDPFRPPPEPWLAGNRGLEYETIPGSLVAAIGPGQVIFAGPVAGDLHVTIRHPDGLRSSYSFLAAIHVHLGQRLATGTTVGVTGEMFHLGVRSGDTYIDPAGLWGRWVRGGLVMLVPDPSTSSRTGSSPFLAEPPWLTEPGAEPDGPRAAGPSTEPPDRGSVPGRGAGRVLGLGAGRVLADLAAPTPSWAAAERPDTLSRRPTVR